jgi:hypothetical protein|tara:strand:+ start:1268 stop:1528 length:261 start_codon:yes stop_codon:yes gene_type:complete
MNIKIIPLAAKKIKLRKITNDIINETIKSPDQTVKGYGDRAVKQKIYNIDNKDKLLRVVCEKEGKDTIVVTAYLTSQVKKYWKSEK